MVVGGGCYGTFYASQLAKAKARGKVDRTPLAKDRKDYFGAASVLGHSASSAGTSSRTAEGRR